MSTMKEAIVAALDQAQGDFQRLVEGLQPADLDYKARADELSIRQYIAHIARAEQVHLNLARLSLRGVHLSLPRWIAPQVIRTFNGLEQWLLREKTYQELLDYQRTGRAILLRFIEQCSNADLEHRCFQLHNFTWAPLSDFFIHVADHQTHHVQDIRAILQHIRNTE